MAKFFSLLLLLSFCYGVNYDRQIKAQKKKLKTVRIELQRQKQKVKEMKQQEEGVLMSLAAIAKSLKQSETFVSELKSHEELQENSLNHLRLEVDSLLLDEEKQQEKMSFRVVSLYKNGRSQYLKILQKAIQEDAARDWVYWKKILNADRDLILKLRSLRTEKAIAESKESEKLVSLKSIRLEKEKQKEELAQQRMSQKDILKLVQTNQKIQAKALLERESNQKLLAKLIRKLEKKARLAKKKRKKKTKKKSFAGKKCWPTKGKVVSSYGLQRHSVLKTLTRNLGIEIKAKFGTPVKTAAAGEVAMITDLQGRGRAVIVQHDDLYFSVYGHLSSIQVKPGQKLNACQNIGRVGDGQSLDGAKLFFQVSHGTETQDPVKWLK